MRTFVVCCALVCAFALVECRSTYGGQDKAMLSRAMHALRQSNELRGNDDGTYDEDYYYELVSTFYAVYFKCLHESIASETVGDECPHVMRVNEAFWCISPEGFVKVLDVISQYKEMMVCVLYNPEEEGVLTDPEEKGEHCKEVNKGEHLEYTAVIKEMKNIEEIADKYRKPHCHDKSSELLNMFEVILEQCEENKDMYECQHVNRVDTALKCVDSIGRNKIIDELWQYEDAMYCIITDSEGKGEYCQEIFNSKHLEHEAIVEEMDKVEHIAYEFSSPECADDSVGDDEDTKRMLKWLLSKMQRN